MLKDSAELLEVQSPWSVRLLQLLWNKMVKIYVAVCVHLAEVSAECRFILQ